MKKKSVSRGGNNSTKTSKETVKYSVKKRGGGNVVVSEMEIFKRRG